MTGPPDVRPSDTIAPATGRPVVASTTTPLIAPVPVGVALAVGSAPARARPPCWRPRASRVLPIVRSAMAAATRTAAWRM
jgi:hypothetical protein